MPIPHQPSAADSAERLEQLSEERRRLHELLQEREARSAASDGPDAAGGGHGHGGTQDPQQAWTPLVPLQPQGHKPPLFIVHAIRGSVFPYHQLALVMGADRPVYGLQSCGLDGKQPPLETNRAMAEAYLAAVRRVQPHGPYHLAGYSMGGWIAYEMGVQLRAAGEAVGFLAALGTPAPPGSHRPEVEMWRWAVKYAEDFLTLLRNSAMADNLDLSRSYFGFQGATSAPGAAAGPGGHPFWTTFAQQTPGLRVSLTNVAAQLRYIADPCQLPVDVFLTTEQTALYWADPSMGWRSLCGDTVTVHHLHGNHLDIFQQPGVQELASILGRRLDAASQPADGPPP